jgi:alcohol dehydrogenase class IV
VKDFVFRMPTRVVFGVGAAAKVGEECKKFKAEKAFLVTGRTATRKAAFFTTVVESLKAANIEVEVYSEVEADPSIETIDAGVEALRRSGADIVIALGGGSPIDASKALTILQTNEGSVRDYIYGKKQITNPTLPLIVIPTTAGTGSEVTAASVVTDKQGKAKLGFSHDYMMPKLAIIDPETHVGMPPSTTAATGIDALTHALEAYVSLNAEPISDALCLHSIKLIGKYLRRAVANGNDIEARSNMVLASLIAGAGFTNAGLGAVHGIAHSLGARYHIAHGVANGLILPYVMECNLIGNLEKFKDIAEALGEKTEGLTLREAAELAVDAVVQLKEDIGIPHTLKEVGVDKKDFPEIIHDTMGYRLLAINPRKLSERDVEKILLNAYGE